MEAEGQDKERRIDELETQLEQQSTEHKRDFNRLQTEQNLADEKARKRIEDLENEKESLLNSQTTALNDQQKFFEKQIERMRADYLQTVEQITKERQEAEERNEVLEQQNKDLATRFDKPISEMRADHPQGSPHFRAVHPRALCRSIAQQRQLCRAI